MLVSSYSNETRVAIIEQGNVSELYFDRKYKKSIVGNIYVGRVENVLPSLDAAFIDIGLDKNAFLYVNEVVLDIDLEESEAPPKKIGQMLKASQMIVVQVTKDAMKNKGARLTTFVSIPGRYLVLAPFNDGIGVSRKLPDADREALREIARELKPKGSGLIVRTAAKEVPKSLLKKDLKILLRSWSMIQKKISKTLKPASIYQENSLVTRLLRDLFSEDFKTIYTDSRETKKEIARYLQGIGFRFFNIIVNPGPEDLFEKYNINNVIEAAIERKVWLKSGGFIVIDHSEAMTSIDVNTGKYTSCKNSSDTILRTNMEAAETICHQLRLRDIGGIIVIDFIDMSAEKDRQKVLARFKQCLEKDKTKTEVLPFSKFGILEMTRKNVADGILGTLCIPCKCCNSYGYVKSEETIRIGMERKIKELAAKSEEKAFLIKLNPKIASLIIGQGGRNLKNMESLTKKYIAIKGDDNLALNDFNLVSKGSVKQIEEDYKPFKLGDIMEIYVEDTYLHNSNDALSRYDGYIIQIIEGKQFIGKKVTVQIKTVSKTTAVAEIKKS